MNQNLNDYAKALMKVTSPFKSEEDLMPLIEQISQSKIVMLGESTHGTSEFYRWRSFITKELMTKHGFNFVAVEGDWPSCQALSQFASHQSDEDSIGSFSHFTRWPTWMWANTEIQDFIEWLKRHNADLGKSITFHGLDVYSLFESIDEVIKSLRKVSPAVAQKAQTYYSCLAAFSQDEMAYARSLFKIPEGCQQEVINALDLILNSKLLDHGIEKNDLFDLTQNAKIIRNAEKYYRSMLFSEENSWNVRDQHMMEMLENLFEHHGANAKGIVWAHNTHVGDYRATDMANRGEVNLGGLAREIYGEENVSLVGFGTHSGTVVASEAWDGPIQIFNIPYGKPGSLEDEYHQVSRNLISSNLYTIFDRHKKDKLLSSTIGHRAIGVVYHPDGDYRRNYVPTSFNNRYDAFVFIDESHAITPLGIPFDNKKFPETYPFGTRL